RPPGLSGAGQDRRPAPQSSRVNNFNRGFLRSLRGTSVPPSRLSGGPGKDTSHIAPAVFAAGETKLWCDTGGKTAGATWVKHKIGKCPNSRDRPPGLSSGLCQRGARTPAPVVPSAKLKVIHSQGGTT